MKNALLVHLVVSFLVIGCASNEKNTVANNNILSSTSADTALFDVTLNYCSWCRTEEDIFRYEDSLHSKQIQLNASQWNFLFANLGSILRDDCTWVPHLIEWVDWKDNWNVMNCDSILNVPDTCMGINDKYYNNELNKFYIFQRSPFANYKEYCYYHLEKFSQFTLEGELQKPEYFQITTFQVTYQLPLFQLDNLASIYQYADSNAVKQLKRSVVAVFKKQFPQARGPILYIQKKNASGYEFKEDFFHFDLIENQAPSITNHSWCSLFQHYDSTKSFDVIRYPILSVYYGDY